MCALTRFNAKKVLHNRQARDIESQMKANKKNNSQQITARQPRSGTRTNGKSVVPFISIYHESSIFFRFFCFALNSWEMFVAKNKNNKREEEKQKSLVNGAGRRQDIICSIYKFLSASKRSLRVCDGERQNLSPKLKFIAIIPPSSFMHVNFTCLTLAC